MGAFGDLHCVNLADGKVIWRKNLLAQFGAKPVTWGMCASPLVIDEKVIVNPGAPKASLVALERSTGKVLWTSPGGPAAYASFIVGNFGGKRQIIGYDAASVGGWDIETGKRLWMLIPPEEGDFNVPTPIDVGGKLLLTSENNGTRLYGFDSQGKIVPEPEAENLDLAPDTSTPVVIDGKVFGCWTELFCLDLTDGLKAHWTAEDEAYEDYVSLIASRDRLLITTTQGELVLADTNAGQYKLVSRLRIFDDGSEVLSHPAIVGKHLYLRSATSVCCVLLAEQ
jgi:outer membrane protein assembly factor BamB